jgi:hypothetical protein
MRIEGLNGKYIYIYIMNKNEIRNQKKKDWN